MKIEKNIMLSKYSYIGIGGKADSIVHAKYIEDIVGALEYADKKKLSYKIVGAMSNILFNDNGFRGILIINELTGVDKKEDGVYVKGGTKIGVLTEFIIKEGCFDIAFLAGIPGTVGAAVKVNAGAWGKSIGDVVRYIDVLIEKGEIVQIRKENIEFEYRKSNIKGIILGAFLETGFNNNNTQKFIIEKMEYRKINHPSEKSLGSVFKNPKPFTAGKLIEEIGFKGKKIGDIMVSPKHGNFIVNMGKGKASDMIKLIQEIKEEVYIKKGIHLETEIEIIGEYGEILSL